MKPPTAVSPTRATRQEQAAGANPRDRGEPPWVLWRRVRRLVTDVCDYTDKRL